MIKIGDVLRIQEDARLIPPKYFNCVVVVIRFCVNHILVRVQKVDLSHRDLYIFREDLI